MQRRLAEALADQITLQLAVFFRKRAAATAERVKLPPQRVAAFLRDPGACRVVLLHGEDHGMIRDRAAALVRAVAGSLDDPFLVAELGRDEVGRLADEAASLPLTGGRRVVRLREATDAAVAPVTIVLKGPRRHWWCWRRRDWRPARACARWWKARPTRSAIACYPEEGRALTDTIRAVLAEVGVGIDADALAWVSAQLGADRVSTRQEMEKLALYVGPGGRVDLDAAMACVGDLAGLSLDDALFAATEGDVARADRALELAMAEGAAPVGVLRAGLMHLQRLHRGASGGRGGLEPRRCGEGGAAAGVLPPGGCVQPGVGAVVFGALMAAMAGLADAERACKRTGAPDEVLSRNAVLTLARRASSARGGRAAR